MKKVTKLLLMVALILGFAACNKEDVPNTGDQTTEGTSYMSITFRLPGQFGTRAEAVPEDTTYHGIGQWEGRDEFKNVDVYLVTDGAKSVERRTLTEVTAAASTQDGIYRTEAWKTTPGTKTVYVVVNNGGDIKTTLDNATVANFADVYKAAYEMLETGKVKSVYADDATDKDIIMMTGQPVTQEINDNVSEAEANKAAETAGANEAMNKVQVTVRRVVSRVSVTMNKGLMTDGVVQIKTDDDKVIGTLKDLSWTPMQYEQTSYLLWQDTEAYTAIATKSPNYAYVPAEGDYETEAPNKYSYDRKNETLPIRTDFVRKTNPENIAYITEQDNNNMEFITETTHSDYRRGNTTYVKVTGTFILQVMELGLLKKRKVVILKEKAYTGVQLPVSSILI